jgi:hypothetical protein
MHSHLPGDLKTAQSLHRKRPANIRSNKAFCFRQLQSLRKNNLQALVGQTHHLSPFCCRGNKTALARV